jgi:D-inositol-3-phosphate glycosyltransferase
LRELAAKRMSVDQDIETCLPPRQSVASNEVKRESNSAERGVAVALLTGSADKPYALGLAPSLAAEGVFVDFIGSDEIDGPELHGTLQIKFLNLRGDQSTKASRGRKLWRVLVYYLRLIRYAATARPRVFHILWNNKFEFFDRTVLMLYYKLLGKKVVFTAHNVNAGKRDLNDSFVNRLSLRIQYKLTDHIFVHSEKMKEELTASFDILKRMVSVIPFGINNTLPKTGLSSSEAKRALGLTGAQKSLLFFGNIAPYKGLDYLIPALVAAARDGEDYQLIIAGRPKGCEPYWKEMQRRMEQNGVRRRVIEKIEYIPDEQVEMYFMAADVLVLPYTHVFQSGVLFLGYSFGLPAIVTDVGSMKDEIIEGKTGFACRAQDPEDLARAIKAYFASDLFKNLADQRHKIQSYANERYSWAKVGAITKSVYSQLAQDGKATRCAGAVRK